MKWIQLVVRLCHCWHRHCWFFLSYAMPLLSYEWIFGEIHLNRMKVDSFEFVACYQRFDVKTASENTSSVHCFLNVNKKHAQHLFERAKHAFLIQEISVWFCERMTNIEHQNQHRQFFPSIWLTLNFVVFCISKQIFIYTWTYIYILKWKYLWIDLSKREFEVFLVWNLVCVCFSCRIGKYWSVCDMTIENQIFFSLFPSFLLNKFRLIPFSNAFLSYEPSLEINRNKNRILAMKQILVIYLNTV